jgi:hypothetical protein
MSQLVWVVEKDVLEIDAERAKIILLNSTV